MNTKKSPTRLTAADEGQAEKKPTAPTAMKKAKSPKTAMAAAKAPSAVNIPAKASKLAKRPASKEGTMGKHGGTKASIVLGLVRRATGATLAQVMETTGWQRHSVRGFLSILGKTVKIVRDAEGRYRAE